MLAIAINKAENITFFIMSKFLIKEKFIFLYDNFKIDGNVGKIPKYAADLCHPFLKQCSILTKSESLNRKKYSRLNDHHSP